MVSSNKHWPSMFKRPNYENSQHRVNSFLTGVHKEERTSQPPRPRWTPRPQQVQILEDIFNSGMMSPPKEEIKKIRERLLEYGPVGHVNVFYWFQNRKARKLKQTKPKNMNPRKRKSKKTQNASSSSSPHASSNEIVVPNNIELPTTNNEVVNLTNDSPNDTIFGDQNLGIDDFDIPIETDFLLSTPPLFSFPSEFSNMTQQLPQQNVDVNPNLLIHEIFMNCANGIPMNEQYDQGNIQDHEAAMNIMQQQEEDPQLMSLCVTSNLLNDDDIALPPLPPIIIDAPVVDPFSITQFQGVTSNSLNDDSTLPSIVFDAPDIDPFSLTQFQDVGEPDHFMAKCTVSINNYIIDVDVGPFNIRQIFGDEAILVDSSGQLVLTDEWGVTLESLQHGGSYFLV
ncbi:WUSCHEL-related homeobox 8-like [Trifolium pratense]|uniref:WUSCHEL-related homeobox 8-like n=1 Tax=Trifolium pratense TaxID=57577 RepID=UPI001E6904C6|nr:WUSCHEL-related homeobox 8-like [Trifolium pratense]